MHLEWCLPQFNSYIFYTQAYFYKTLFQFCQPWKVKPFVYPWKYYFHCLVHVCMWYYVPCSVNSRSGAWVLRLGVCVAPTTCCEWLGLARWQRLMRLTWRCTTQIRCDGCDDRLPGLMRLDLLMAENLPLHTPLPCYVMLPLSYFFNVNPYVSSQAI